MRALLPPGCLSDALHFAAVGGDGENLAVSHHGGTLVGGRKIESLGFADGDELVAVGRELRIGDERAVAGERV